MNKIFMKGFTIPFLVMLVSLTGRMYAYADTEDGTKTAKEQLKVMIRDQNGAEYVQREGEILYSNRTLNIAIRDPEYIPEGEIENINDYYSFSYDAGETFGEEFELGEGGLDLACVSSKDEFYLKMYRYYKVKKMISQSEDGDESENSRDSHEENESSDTTKDNDGDLSCDAEDEISEDEIPDDNIQDDEIPEYEETEECYESMILHIVFDTDAPMINECSGLDFANWVNYIRSADFRAYDDAGYIERIIAREGDNILYEYHYDRDADGALSETNFEIPLAAEAQNEDGRTIDITAVDGAGNICEEHYSYYLDMTKPTLAYTGVKNGSINDKDISLNAVSTDNIISKTSILITAKGSKGKSEWEMPDLTAWPVEGTLAASEFFSEDGNYTVSIRASDAAGNESETVNLSFRVDKTAPDISVGGFEYGLDYRTDVGVHLSVSEDFYEDTKIEYRIVRRTPDKEETYVESTGIPEDIKFQKNIALTEDGDYEICLSAMDAAGNTSSKTASVRVDKTAPLLLISGLSDKEVTGTKPTLTIGAEELFYDSSKISAVLYEIKDGNILESVMERNFEMEDEKIIIPLEINEEGAYIMEVTAYDRAGNTARSALEFTVDLTAPEIGWLGSINRKYFKRLTLPARFLDIVSDSTKTNCRAYLNAYELTEGATITKDGKYIFRVTAIDEAGNITDESAEFIIDATPPRIVAKGITDKNKVSIGDTVTLTLFDSDDIFTSLSVNGKKVKILDNGRRCMINIDKDSEYKINVKAVDEAGNETEKLFVLSASAFKVPENITKVVHNVMQNAVESNDEKTNKISDKKYAYFAIPLIICILGLSLRAWAFSRRIDVTK